MHIGLVAGVAGSVGSFVSARLATEFTTCAEDAGLNVEELELDAGQDILCCMKDALPAAESDGLLADEE